MQLRYRISLDDYLEAQRLIWSLRFRRTTVWGIRAFLGLVAMVLIIPWLLLPWSARPNQIQILWQNDSPILTILAALLAYFLLIRPWTIRRAYLRNPDVRREINAEVDSTGLRAADDAGNRSEIVWSHFNRFTEGRRTFVLGTPGNIFHIVSKSGMDADGQLQFRQILAACVPSR
jgi:uncharacterized membrane protein YbhN (UPF0104 family)